ncbi:hypothetical protein TUM4438_46120 [Shewanella sairae]|uniref:Uncharacterized protein n=1 Tax=Shewanella sairae TaxID=190310 RepID=A0ABQ4PS62_9GAMM|nr:hypothetical protein [Shewanella sairae]MCL1132579.1 hypothetical protein [Shewanella sairae]GIU52739.1 hypothetical protein TUM4438_46120 [Shewanella sairae]
MEYVQVRVQFYLTTTDTYQQKALTGSKEFAAIQSSPEARMKQGMNDIMEQAKKEK